MIRKQSRLPCRNYDPEIWFPVSAGSVNAQLGKELCRECPARRACLQQAYELDVIHGTWGGQTQWERLARRQRQHGSADKKENRIENPSRMVAQLASHQGSETPVGVG